MIPANDIQISIFDAGEVFGIFHSVHQVFRHDFYTVLFDLSPGRYRQRRHGHSGPTLVYYFLENPKINQTLNGRISGKVHLYGKDSHRHPLIAYYLANEQSGDLFLFREQRQVVAHHQHLVRYEHVRELIRLLVHDCWCSDSAPIKHDTRSSCRCEDQQNQRPTDRLWVTANNAFSQCKRCAGLTATASVVDLPLRPIDRHP